ncbi:MAG: polysaccharide deacetylase family protein [Gemmatimonadota bacterium]|nr:polysaccharide deacetylase family protein [Gemmatimonadota bacterium]
MLRPSYMSSVFLITSLACGEGNALPVVKDPGGNGATPSPAPVGPLSQLPPNELGRIPILEYHLFGDTELRWQRETSRFRRDLELLYGRGYRPVSVSDLVDGKLDLPAGTSPIVFTFDDASPSQFRYIETNGALVVDSTSAIGIWMDFAKSHPGWSNKATFCLLSGAEAGRSFFGNKDIEGQRTEWRFRKVKWLAEQGFELCNHTLWHANLGKYDDAFVQEQIARGVLAIDSVIPGYRVRTFALPLGIWPKNRALASRGEWRDPKSGRVVTYDFDAVLRVAGDPVPSPTDPAFDAKALERVQVTGEDLERVLDRLDRSGTRYVSDGISGTRNEGAMALRRTPTKPVAPATPVGF